MQYRYYSQVVAQNITVNPKINVIIEKQVINVNDIFKKDEVCPPNA